MIVELENLLILSTAHLHPLEAKVIDKFAYVANKECALVITDDEMRDFYYKQGLVCLCDALKIAKEKFNVKYVLFDPDADAMGDFKYFVW